MSSFRKYSYNQFQSYIGGRGYSRADISNLWANYKLENINNKDLDDLRTLKAYLVSREVKTPPRKASPQRKKTPRRTKKLIKSSTKSKLSTISKKTDITKRYLGTKYVPREISWEFMLHMNLHDILNLCSVDKYYAEEVCTDDFWKYYVLKKYAVKEKFVHQSWKEWVMDITFRYDSIIGLTSTRTPKDVIKITYGTLENTDKIKKAFGYDDDISYLIDNNLHVNRYDKYIGSSVMLDAEMFSDGYSKKIYRNGVWYYMLFFISINGAIYYSVGNEEIVFQKDFYVLPNIKAYAITNKYIILRNGNILRYDLIEADIIISEENIPVPFKFISAYESMTHYGGKRQEREWTFALDLEGKVWAKGDNHRFQLGLESKKDSSKFSKVNIPIKIKKIVSGDFISAFLGIDNSLWLAGKFTGIPAIYPPRKIELVISKKIKGNLVNITLKIVDISYRHWHIVFSDIDNNIYKIGSKKKILRMGTTRIPKKYKEYRLFFDNAKGYNFYLKKTVA